MSLPFVDLSETEVKKRIDKINAFRTLKNLKLHPRYDYAPKYGLPKDTVAFYNPTYPHLPEIGVEEGFFVCDRTGRSPSVVDAEAVVKRLEGMKGMK